MLSYLTFNARKLDLVLSRKLMSLAITRAKPKPRPRARPKPRAMLSHKPMPTSTSII